MPASFEVDRVRLSRVIGNLVENAIKYTDDGNVSVTADMKRAGSISGEAKERLFSYRGRPDNASKPGSGLGLHIAKSLIDQMGGKIEISNERGGRVDVTVPVTRYESSGTGSLSILPSTQLPDMSGMTVLLAEDNTTNQMVVTQMLSAMGAHFVVASDGVEAIVALTAYALREHRERIADAGADGMIPKPILGIEEFGEDLLRHSKRSTKQAQTANGAKPEAAAIIDEVAYANLSRSIGPEMMDELLASVRHGSTPPRLSCDDLCRRRGWRIGCANLR